MPFKMFTPKFKSLQCEYSMYKFLLFTSFVIIFLLNLNVLSKNDQIILIYKINKGKSVKNKQKDQKSPKYYRL